MSNFPGVNFPEGNLLWAIIRGIILRGLFSGYLAIESQVCESFDFSFTDISRCIERS